MKINRTDLLNAVQKLLSGTDQKSFIEGADTVFFNNDSIHSYNDSISVTSLFSTGLSGSVKIKYLFKALQKLSTEEIEVIQGEGKWTIISGRTEVTLDLQTDKLSEHLSKLQAASLSFIDLPANFFDGLRLCRIPGNSTPYRGIFVEKELMISTDEIRINYFDMNGIMSRFWVDDIAVDALTKIQEQMTSYSIDAAWIHFKGSSGTIFSCKRNADEQYPSGALLKYKEEYSQREGDSANTLPKTFDRIIDRVGIFHTDIDGYQAVGVSMTKDELLLVGKADAGSIKESLKWDSPFPEALQISFQSDFNFLREISSKCPQFFLRKNSEGGADVVFHNANFKQLLRTLEG